jgi:hypothetical protein
MLDTISVSLPDDNEKKNITKYGIAIILSGGSNRPWMLMPFSVCFILPQKKDILLML